MTKGSQACHAASRQVLVEATLLRPLCVGGREGARSVGDLFKSLGDFFRFSLPVSRSNEQKERPVRVNHKVRL